MLKLVIANRMRAAEGCQQQRGCGISQQQQVCNEGTALWFRDILSVLLLAPGLDRGLGGGGSVGICGRGGAPHSGDRLGGRTAASRRGLREGRPASRGTRQARTAASRPLRRAGKPPQVAYKSQQAQRAAARARHRSYSIRDGASQTQEAHPVVTTANANVRTARRSAASSDAKSSVRKATRVLANTAPNLAVMAANSASVRGVPSLTAGHPVRRVVSLSSITITCSLPPNLQLESANEFDLLPRKRQTEAHGLE